MTFTAHDCSMFAPKGEVVKWEDGKLWLKPLQERVNDIGLRCLKEHYSGPVEVDLHKSRPNQTNAHHGAMAARQSFVDIFPRYSPANPNLGMKKAYTMQIYFRITRHGGEVGFCWGSWESQGKPELVDGYLEGREWIRWRLSNAPAGIRSQLGAAVRDNGFRYVDQWMDGVSDEKYPDLPSWIEGACSDKGASHAIIKTFTPAELEGLGEGVEGVVRDAVDMFTPLFDHVSHNPTAVGRPASAGEPGKQWLKGYQKAQTDSRSRYTDPFTRDPDTLDRANNAHSRLQNELRDFIRDAGHRTSSPKSNKINFDLAWEARGVLYVAEVKSIIDSNEQSQLRHGLGQVLHYKRQLMEHYGEVEAVLAVERRPSDPIWEGVCEMAGVTLVWPGEFMRCLQASGMPSEDEAAVPDWFTQALEGE